jgi:hypothetical protein
VSVTALGGLTIDGVLALAAGAGSASLFVHGGQTVGGAGTLFLSPENDDAGTGVNQLFLGGGAGTEPLILGPALTLRAGSGDIRTIDSDPVTLEGRLVVDADADLDILRPLTLGDDASFVFRLDTPASFGTASTNSALALDGDLVLEFAPDGGFAEDDAFDILSGGTLTGDFDAVVARDLPDALQAVIDLRPDLLSIDLA